MNKLALKIRKLFCALDFHVWSNDWPVYVPKGENRRRKCLHCPREQEGTKRFLVKTHCWETDWQDV